MSPADLTVKILQEIRDSLRESRVEQRAFRVETTARFAAVDGRFEVIETSLRDMAEQMVMHGRALRVLLEGRSTSGVRIDDLETRVEALEKKVS